jgi:putative membrane protein
MSNPVHSLRFVPLLAALLALAPLATGCGSKTTTDQSATETPADTTTAASLNDANIAAIVLAANDAEIDLGQLGQSKARNADVKAFAKQMETDHGAVNKNAKDLAGRLSLTPEDNATSEQIKSDAKATKEALEAAEGAAFDKAYVDHEVKYHEDLLAAIDNTLLPSAQNADLKQLLTDTRPAVVAHLEHAKNLQAKLGSTSANP